MLRAVAQSGRYTAAAQALGLNHTTVSRRIAALEKALGGRVLAHTAEGWELTALGARAADAAVDIAAAVARLNDDDGTLSGVVRMSATDGFSAFIAAPAFARLRAVHPALSIEIVATTRRASQTRTGLDFEVVVGEPQVHRAEAIHLGPYVLGLYASRDYLAAKATPSDLAEVLTHPLVYFIDSMLQVDGLDTSRRLLPTMRDALSCTNVFVHVEATRVGAGIGLLPCFMADRHPDLVRLLPDLFAERLDYWLVVRPEPLRRPAVAAVVQALRELTRELGPQLLGATGTSGAQAQ